MARPRDNDFGQSLPSTHIHRRFWGMIGSIPSAQATSCEVGTVWVRTMALPERPGHAQIGVRNCLGAPSDPARLRHGSTFFGKDNRDFRSIPQ